LGEVNQLISTINDRLGNEGKYNSSKVIEFIEKLALTEVNDQIRICLELKRPFISILTQEKLRPYLNDFLKVYEKMIESDQYGWAFSENIANNMQRVFKEKSVPNKVRAKALELAIDTAYRMNRFAAMETCIAMITSVDQDELGVYVAAIMQKNEHDFIVNIEGPQCKCDSIRNYLQAVQH